MKIKNKPKHYFEPFFGGNFWFFLGWPESMVSGFILKHLKIDYRFNDCDGKTIEIVKDGRQLILIWTRRKNDIPIIVHECDHAANFLLKSRGVIADHDNDETHAYLLQHLIEFATKL